MKNAGVWCRYNTNFHSKSCTNWRNLTYISEKARYYRYFKIFKGFKGVKYSFKWGKIFHQHMPRNQCLLREGGGAEILGRQILGPTVLGNKLISALYHIYLWTFYQYICNMFLVINDKICDSCMLAHKMIFSSLSGSTWTKIRCGGPVN
jgi:hypothetical protein